MRLFGFLLLFFLLGFPQAQAADPSNVTQTKSQPTTLRAPSVTLKAQTLKPLTPLKINRNAIKKLPQLRPVVTPKSVKPKGPDPKAALDLSDIIEDPELLEDLGEVCGWDSHLIFQDEAAGHVFYYLPREILLLYDHNGYKLNVQYNYRAEPGQPSVTVTAELAAPHRQGDVILLKTILREALGLKPSDPLELRSLKGLGATVDLQAITAGLSLPPERIHMDPPGHLKQSLHLILSLTQDEVEEVLAQITREGLRGTLKVQVGAESASVPIRIQYGRFSGERIKGLDDWVKGKSINKLTNLTEFPLEVQSIDAYCMRQNRLERVSKRLKEGKRIPPKAYRPLKLPEANRVLGKGVLVAWLGGTLDTQCTACLQSIDQEVRKGVALTPSSPITLEAIPGLFSEFDIYKLVVRVRSPYFVVGGSEVREQEVALTEDENLNKELTIYVPSDRGPEPLLYRYQIQVVKTSGEAVEESEWHDASKLSQFFGSSHLEGMLAGPEETGIQ